MSECEQQDLDDRLERMQQRWPNSLGKVVGWVRAPSSRSVRLPLGIALTAGGTVGFLPIVGFWMLPLGLALIAKDVPRLHPPLVRFFDWIERKITPNDSPIKGN
jgi:hypothetical protein